jgi:uncharacterized repeat protein (TIGR03803 family)
MLAHPLLECFFVKARRVFANSKQQLFRCLSSFCFSSSSLAAQVTLFALNSAVAALLVVGANRLEAQVTILHSFGDGTVPNDGVNPQASLIQAPDGNFYGVSVEASLKTGGAVFQITPAGVLTVIKSFAKRQDSFQSLLYYKGSLVGVRAGPLRRSNGDVFAVTGYPNGRWVLDDWHIFSGGPSDGMVPQGNLILGSDGDLFGTTYIGGSAGEGSVYKIDPNTHQLTILDSFSGLSPICFPVSALVQANDGNFYGASEGSFPGGVFKMTANGKVMTFFVFPGNSYPTGPLIQGGDGNFYGTSADESSPLQQYVFKLTPGAVFTVLHTFLSPKPDARLGTYGVIQGPNGNLYGVTEIGGTAGKGTVFELSTDGSSYNVLHNFGDGSLQNDGQLPVANLVVGADNNLYGVTFSGGSAGLGTVYKISP